MTSVLCSSSSPHNPAVIRWGWGQQAWYQAGTGQHAANGAGTSWGRAQGYIVRGGNIGSNTCPCVILYVTTIKGPKSTIYKPNTYIKTKNQITYISPHLRYNYFGLEAQTSATLEFHIGIRPQPYHRFRFRYFMTHCSVKFY